MLGFTAESVREKKESTPTLGEIAFPSLRGENANIISIY